MKPSPEFEPGQIVYRMGRQANWVEVLEIGTYMQSPFPHYWVQRDGVTFLESKLRLSPRPLDDVLNRDHRDRQSKKKASDATTPASAADQSEVTK
ncbi:MAG: hypothetical protein ACPG3W_11945 [Synechococcus sp.]